MHQLLDKKSKLVNSTLERLHAEEDQVVAHVAEGGAVGAPERRVARTQKKSSSCAPWLKNVDLIFSTMLNFFLLGFVVDVRR